MDIGSIVMKIFALLIALTFHEFAHAWTALRLGDDTAANEGRLSINPIDHVDPLGTILFPLVLILTHSPVVIGWAKPVPVNPFNFNDQEKGMFLTSLSGPTMNLLLALISLIAIKILFLFNLQTFVTIKFLRIVIILNVFLAFFNFLPIPPLDGYKVLTSILPLNISLQLKKIEPYGFLILISLIYFNIIDKILLIPSRFILSLLL